MSLILDHFFTFVSPNQPKQSDPIFEALNCQVARKHTGQGTENVCALFEDNYLEFIWVNDEGEVRKTGMGLYERSKWRENGSCPFGICFRNNMSDITSMDDIEKYEPVYIPKGMAIEFSKRAMNPFYPELFSIAKAQRSADREDCNHVDFNHPIGRLNLNNITITYPHTKVTLATDYMESISEKVTFREGDSWHADVMLLTNDELDHYKTVHSHNLPMTLHLRSGECMSEHYNPSH